jgi:putative transposase
MAYDWFSLSLGNMRRPLRIQYEDAWYHVMNRGRRSERILEVRMEYLLFMELMKNAAELWDIRLSAYYLMTNHYHMVVNTPRDDISRCMRHIDGVYTQRFNRSHGFDGLLKI